MNGFVLSAFAASRRSVRPATAAASTRISLFSSSPTAIPNSSKQSKKDYFTVGITGASGMVGNALVDELLNRGETTMINGKPIRVVRLSRGDKAEAKVLENEALVSLVWNPHGTTADDVIHPDAAAAMDSIVHLSGENVSTNMGLGPLNFIGIRPWTQKKKDEIINSRVVTTKALAKVVAQSDGPKTLLAASGVGVYGDNFIDESSGVADESTDVTGVDGFLAQVSREWEGATEEAIKAETMHRVINMRFAVAMSKKGGALQKLYPIFLLGGGGKIGNGKQYFTFISARDLARAIVHCLETPSLEGPVNLCAPNPCTNLEFTKALGSVLNRPTFLPFPGFAV